MAPPLLSEPATSARRSLDLATSPSNTTGKNNNRNLDSSDNARVKTKISSFFESILLFLLAALRKLFTSFGRKEQATSYDTGQLQPTSPSIIATRRSDLELNTMARAGASTMPPRPPSGTPPPPQGTSPTPSTAVPGRRSNPRVFPALPRILPNKVKGPRTTTPPTSTAAGTEGLRQMANGIAALNLNGKPVATSERSDENKAGPNGSVQQQRNVSVEKIAAQSTKPSASAQPNAGDARSSNAQNDSMSKFQDDMAALRPKQQQQRAPSDSGSLALLQDATNSKNIDAMVDVDRDQENGSAGALPGETPQGQTAPRAPRAPSVAQYSNEAVQIKARVPILNVGIQYSPEERAVHAKFINEALDMARLALKTNETPVGCVLVQNGRIIAKGMNATNRTRNGTRHAELMALSALLSFSPASDQEAPSPTNRSAAAGTELRDKTNKSSPQESLWGDVDPKDGHLFPYGQKLHPSPRVDKTIIQECTLYVTVEPCVMCASLLRQLRIKKVFFGAVNDKFGGTGGVFRIHQNAPGCRDVMASAPPSPTSKQGVGIVRPVAAPRASSTVGFNTDGNSSSDDRSDGECAASVPRLILEGDGGQVEPGYLVEGGWGRDEAVTLLRQFYVQENGRAPVPRKKEGRAARLAAMMERDGHAGGPMISVNEVPGLAGKSDAESQSTDGEKSEKGENPSSTVANSGNDQTENTPPVDLVQPEMVAGHA